MKAVFYVEREQRIKTQKIRILGLGYWVLEKSAVFIVNTVVVDRQNGQWGVSR